MNGKGDKRRPENTQSFSSGWDRIWGEESDNPTEGGFWKHNCPKEGQHHVGKGEECNWCGEKEA